ATLFGAPPTWIVRVTRPESSAMREMVPSPWLTTQTEPSPIAMPVGIDPTFVTCLRLMSSAFSSNTVAGGDPDRPVADGHFGAGSPNATAGEPEVAADVVHVRIDLRQRALVGNDPDATHADGEVDRRGGERDRGF